MIFIGNQLKVIDVLQKQIANVYTEPNAAVDTERFYDFVMTDEKFRVMILCRVNTLRYMMKLDYDTNSFVDSLDHLI